MKLKESKGMPVIVITIILAVLVVVAGGVIVYLLNNPVKENVPNHEKNELVNATALEKYILGKDLAGRNFKEILNESGEEEYFINEESTIPNASKVLKILASIGGNNDDSMIFYINDNRDSSNKLAYKFKVNYYYNEATEELKMTTNAEFGVVEVYKKEEGTRVGKTVRYDNKIWTIIYDDDTNGLQMVSNETLLYHDGFAISSAIKDLKDTEKASLADIDDNGKVNDFETAVYLYNNVIDILNKGCEKLVTKNSKILDVRCVGSDPLNKNSENKKLYNSRELDIWPIDNNEYPKGIGNDLLKCADENYTSDFERMLILGIDSVKPDCNCERCTSEIENYGGYWLASHTIYKLREWGINFEIRFIGNRPPNGSWNWLMFSTDSVWVGGDDYFDAIGLRPVVSIDKDVSLKSDSSGKADYIF